MDHEIELKLDAPPTAVEKVASLAWLRKLMSGPAAHKKLVSVYFDTPKLKLRDRGMVIRVRHLGKRRLQTIKAVRRGERGAFSRYEWEHEISGDAPDLKLAQDSALAPLITPKLRRKLKPIFETVVERTTLPIHSDGTDMELAVDRGHIKAHGGREREPISEIEIELKHGDPAELSRIAKRLARSLPVAYGPQSKAERGYALSTKDAGRAIHSGELDLDARLSTGDAFQVIGLFCLDHALSNHRAARGGDAEGIHQMRVGLRQLRAALSVFKELVQGSETEAIKIDLKWLTGQLSLARDLDVLIEERVRPLRKSAPIAAEAGVLQEDLDARRDAGREQVKAALDGKRYRTLGLATALWLADGEWLRNDAALIAVLRKRPVTEFAAEALTVRRKKILKKARRIESLDARGRHKLRIAIKKLRYACDFFSGLYMSGKQEVRLGRFRKTLKTLQTALGTLNDIEVHKGLAKTIERPERPARAQARKALAMGFIAGQEQKEAAACIVAVNEAAACLSRLPVFWK